MPKQIIVLEKTGTSGGDRSIRTLFWLAVPAGQEKALPGATSEFAEATSAENAAIATGSVIEEVFTLSIRQSATIAQIKAALVERFNLRQAEITARNTNQYYGVFYDGTWSA